MGVLCRNKWTWGSMMSWLIFATVFAIGTSNAKTSLLVSEGEYANHKHARRKLDDIGGSISIDCGILEDSDYHDVKTDIPYTSDAQSIDTGENKNISSKFDSETLPKYLKNVRSFPQGKRNCYTLLPPEGKDTVYLIRASFMYGNYDDQDHFPEFELYVGVNLWDSVKFDNESHIVIKEIVHVPSKDEINVCLLNIDKGTPFISALELRHFHNSSYRSRTESVSMALYRRFDVGSTTDQIVRFKDDSYDRMWFPYNFPNSVPLNTTSVVDSLNANEYKLPSLVMKTAITPMNANDSLDFELDTGDSTLKFYVYLHFAELERLEENQRREFDISLNDIVWEKNVVPVYLQSTTIHVNRSVTGNKLKFSMHKTPRSTLPPILNAMEVYVVIDFLQAPTDEEDVNAIMEIKSKYEVRKVWQGDPCIPSAWDGLDCSKDNGYGPPRILYLNLASSGFKGQISPWLAKLTSLEYLNLSNNSLTGELPDFWSQLPNLKALNLSGNKLTGSVPSTLLERSKSGSLSLSVDGNPDLCVVTPCKKKKKNFVVPLIAAIASILVVLIVLVILWSYRRKRAAKQVGRPQEGARSLESNNRQFTYTELVSITNNFQTVVGKGGFGTVYHGYLNDGTQVAVKMLSHSSVQGSKEFQTEAQLLMRVHHRNLASLVGYCNESRNNGIVFEYMSCGNLEQYLSDKTKNVLSWKERVQIAVDSAQGLEYLHHGCRPPIIHRDVKTANILLNEKLQAKIADFGFSKSFPIESQSHLSTAVVGTYGYLDPEYYTSNRITEKSDVYSFGIVLLELITSKPAIIKSHENTHIVQWVSPPLARGDIRSIVDPRLEGKFDTNSVWKMMEIAMACVPSISIQRPSMSHVLMELKECLEIEKAHEQNWEMESQMTISTNSLEFMNPMCLETELTPQAR